MSFCAAPKYITGDIGGILLDTPLDPHACMLLLAVECTRLRGIVRMRIRLPQRLEDVLEEAEGVMA